VLERQATGSGARLDWLIDSDALDEAGEIIGEVDRFRILSRVLHSELVGELRWDDEQVARTRDGIDISTLALSNADRAALELITHWPVAEFLRSINGGSALLRGARRSLRASSALCLLTCANNAACAYLGGGSALQRVWLEATRLGLGVQPLSVAPYLFARLLSGGAGLAPEEAHALSGLWQRFQRLFGVAGNPAMLLLFRVFRGPAPSVRSLRRPADDVLLLPGR
jgi:hypothetical protein